ncbi:MAG: hypothetical protein WEA99_00600 [Brumimicrobium sp.]
MEQIIKAKKEFNKIFNNKGNIAPIAEKSHRNFSIVINNPVNTDNRLHHFSIGHVFKDISTKYLFKYELNETEKKLVPTQYFSLQSENFTFKKHLFKVIENIRNINSHYVHIFDFIELDMLSTNKDINQQITKFIIESFEVSVVINYLREKEMTYDVFLEDDKSDKKLVSYLCDMFYPNMEHQKEERDYFLNLNKNDAIKHLLFIEVETEIDWKLFEEHSVFSIKPGRYLTFHACLFLLSIFLYKDEANQLISKIKGFKRTEDKYSYKRNIFTFYAKKFRSQDISSEEKYLVRFRDIISYLNKYPTQWNKHLELESDFPKMTELLEKKIIETEIFRSFPKYEEDSKRKKFLQFATKKLFGTNFYQDEEFDYTAKEDSDFTYQINTSPELQKTNSEIARLERKNRLNFKEEKDLKKLKNRKDKLKKVPNQIKTKLLIRIKENILFKSYGRNQDRLMQFAIRFLAENSYFGEDTEFKVYQFYTTDEQEKYISELKNKNGQKSLDKLKYHNGKLTHYATFKKHSEKYEEWDTPFVIQNNSFKLKLKFIDGTEKLLTIQRGLLLYLLEHSLFHVKSNLNSSGKYLLEKYYNKYLKEVTKGKEILEGRESISAVEKNKLKRFFPKRLLHQYLPAQQNNLPEKNTFELILGEAILQESRYKNLLENAKKLNLEERFLEKNKGKQFKLRFVRKAWQLMYFSEIYFERASVDGHHKAFNITKEQFNDFSRWMFAFDEVPEFKQYLASLFEQKHFFKNNEFKKLFEESASLNDLYVKTKERYLVWLKSNEPSFENSKYNYANYKKLLHENQWFINVSHFIDFLIDESILNKNKDNIIQYKALSNKKYLINEFYYSDTLSKDEYKTNGKLFNKLRKVKLEDALLYELAVYYLRVDKSIIQKVKSHVSNILTSDFTFNIQDKSGRDLYNLLVPFNKLESLAVLLNHKVEQEKNPKFRRTSFLGNIDTYLNSVENINDLDVIIQQKKDTGTLNFEHLNTVYNHIISQSLLFTRVEMKLEEYFIAMYKNTISSNTNHIKWDEVKNDTDQNAFSGYFNSRTRNKAFHFGVPDSDSKKMIKEKIESKFINDEIKPCKPKRFEDLNPLQKSVCRLFMDVLHHDYFRKTRANKNETIEEKKERLKKERTQFEDKYFNEMIK